MYVCVFVCVCLFFALSRFRAWVWSVPTLAEDSWAVVNTPVKLSTGHA